MLEYQKGRRTHTNGPKKFGLAVLNCHDIAKHSASSPHSIMQEATHQTAITNMAATQTDLLNQLAAMHEKYIALAANSNNPPPTVSRARHTTPTPQVTPTPPTPSPVATPIPDNQYCWSHGFSVRPGHTSATCSKTSEGH